MQTLCTIRVWHGKFGAKTGVLARRIPTNHRGRLIDTGLSQGHAKHGARYIRYIIAEPTRAVILTSSPPSSPPDTPSVSLVMFPSHGSTAQWPGKIINILTTNTPDDPPRGNRLAPGVQGIQPSAHRTVQTNNTLITSPSERVPRNSRPAPGVQTQSARSQARPAPVPQNALREIRPAPGVQKVAPTKRQPANLPGPTHLPAKPVDVSSGAPCEIQLVPAVQRATPTEQQSVNTSGSPLPSVRFADVNTPNNPPKKSVTIPLEVLSCSFANNPAILAPTVSAM